MRNALILTGDVRSHWAADVRERPDDVSARLVATELVTTSITSGLDGPDSRDEIDAVRPESLDIRCFSNRRGYVRTRITPDEARADFRVLPFVSSPGAPAPRSWWPIAIQGCARCEPSLGIARRGNVGAE